MLLYLLKSVRLIISEEYYKGIHNSKDNIIIFIIIKYIFIFSKINLDFFFFKLPALIFSNFNKDFISIFQI